MDNRQKALMAINGLTPEEMASFEVLHVTETFKKTLVKNGGLVLGRLLQVQGNYFASAKQRSNKAKFNMEIMVERSINHTFGVMACRLQLYVACYAKRVPTERPDRVMSRIVALMCEELSAAINKQVRTKLFL
jgi:hypothetical protein